jgi:glucose/arabinose dehydrogenase
LAAAGAALVVVASLWTSIAVAPIAAAGPTPPAPFLGEQGVDGSGGTTQLAPRQLAPTGFQDTVVFNGLSNPTSMRFSPDGRVFVAEKSGLIKVFASWTGLRAMLTSFWRS